MILSMLRKNPENRPNSRPMAVVTVAKAILTASEILVPLSVLDKVERPETDRSRMDFAATLACADVRND